MKKTASPNHLSEKSTGRNEYRWLYQFAWGYEILAAATGIAMALVFNSQAYVDAQSDGIIDIAELTGLVAGTLPFLMVAAAELCKIPLITAVMRARNVLWKASFTIVAAFAAFITFETVATGLESANAIRGKPITKLNQSINNKEREIEVLTQYTKEALDSDVAKRREEVNISHDKQILAIEVELNNINEKYQNLLTGKTQPLKDRIQTIKERQSNQRQARANKIANAQKAVDAANRRLRDANEALKSCIRCIQEEANIKSAERALAEAKEGLSEAEREHISGDNEIKKLEQEITNIENEITLEKNEAVNQTDEKLKNLNNRLAVNLADIDKKYQQDIKNIADNQSKIQKIQREINRIKNEKASKVNDNLVYRISGKFYGKEAGDITESDAAVVGNIIAGTIGFLVSIIGPFIIVAYLVLSRQHETNKSAFRSLAKSIYALSKSTYALSKAIVLKKRNPPIKEVEVVKKIPVEKIVVKHVPIYTDDKSLVQLAGEYSQDDKKTQ